MKTYISTAILFLALLLAACQQTPEVVKVTQVVTATVAPATQTPHIEIETVIVVATPTPGQVSSPEVETVTVAPITATTETAVIPTQEIPNACAGKGALNGRTFGIVTPPSEYQGANLFYTPTVDSEIDSFVPQGTCFLVHGKSITGSYYAISTGLGEEEELWISSEFLELQNPDVELPIFTEADWGTPGTDSPASNPHPVQVEFLSYGPSEWLEEGTCKWVGWIYFSVTGDVASRQAQFEGMWDYGSERDTSNGEVFKFSFLFETVGYKPGEIDLLLDDIQFSFSHVGFHPPSTPKPGC